MSLKYSIQISWSDEDNAFLASIPELPGCMADGPTVQAAAAAVYEVAAKWITTAKELAREVPGVLKASDYEALADEFRSAIQKQVKRQVEEAVGRVMQELSRYNPVLAGTKDPADYWKG